MNRYFDVYHQEGNSHVFCYRSGLMVYEEELCDGALISRGYNASGYPLNVLTNFPSRLDKNNFAEPFAFNLEINGCSVDYDLEFVSFFTEKSERSAHAILTLKSRILPVGIKVHTILDGTQMFTRFLEVENLSAAPITVSRISILGGGLETVNRAYLGDVDPSAELYSVGCFEKDVWAREGQFVWKPLESETTSFDFRFFKDRYRHPLIFLRNNLTGGIWFSQIAFSGGCRYTVNYNLRDRSCADRTDISHLSLKAEILSHNPMLVLSEKECYTLPEVHMGYVLGDLDDAVNEMHAHVRASVLCAPEIDPSACLIGCGMGAEHDMSVATSKAFIDMFAEMGGEIFIIDAGWQNPPNKETEWGRYNGLNHYDKDRYPNGLEELSDYCHQKGLKFALWTEIERIGECSPVGREHPEWFAADVYGATPKTFLDFTNPEAAAWAESELARIITEYKLDLLRVDYNAANRAYCNLRDRGTGIRENLMIRHYDAVCRMYANLKKRFPNVIFENCAGGGGRTDLAQMKAFNHTWVSDHQVMPYSITITNGMTMALPPERVDRLFAGMGCHKVGSLDAHMRNTMLGHMSLNVISPAAAEINPVQMEFVQHSVKLYKDFIRPMLPTCKIYHHTPDTTDAMKHGYVAEELAAPDRTKGVLSVITLSGKAPRRIKINLKGIDPAKRYRVTMDNDRTSFEADGRTLSNEGVTVCISAALSSELVLYEAL